MCRATIRPPNLSALSRVAYGINLEAHDGKEIIGYSASGLKKRRYGDSDGRASSHIFIGRCVGFVGPLASSEEDVDSEPFLPGDAEVRESHDILSRLNHLEFQRRLDGLSLTELANFPDVSALNLETELLYAEGKSLIHEVTFVHDLKAENEKQVKDIASLCELSHLVQNSKKILKVDAETLRSRCRKFKEKEAIMLATEASLKTELEALKEKLDLANEDRSLMVTGLLPHVVKTLFSSNFFSILLADLQTKAMLVSRVQAFEEVVGICLGV
ncbi:hypothetical protein Tco_1381744 [Tanacetum coccineum]